MIARARKWGLLLVLACPWAWAVPDVDPYIRHDSFNEIKLSPTGEYYAASVPLEDRTGLVIIRRADNQVTGTFGVGSNSHVDDFSWVSADRLLIGLAEKQGALDQPRPNGELYTIRADGSGADLLVGYRVAGNTGSHIQVKKAEDVAAFLEDEVHGDERFVVISVWPFSEKDVYSRAERLDVTTGRRSVIARSPVINARFSVDDAGQIRFADGYDADNGNVLYYRAREGEDWRRINSEKDDGHFEHPVGFSADGRIAYLQVGQPEGPDAIVAWDTVNNTRKVVLRDAVADPARILYEPGTHVPVGMLVMADRPRTLFIDADSSQARLYRNLEAAFPGQGVVVTSMTRDGRLMLVNTWSGSGPGDFYVFDNQAKKAQFLVGRKQWFDPARMAQVRPFSLTARDGVALRGFLTLPHGSDGHNLPMVVLPHGGPFGIADTWHFDDEAQLLASAGYAVLQVNFRGSGNYGQAFQSAGARQWGQAMQDDVTDATRWAISEGIADRGRICLYGASYGGYAALMGVVREPALYRCAAGYVGVYDLPSMYVTGDIQRRGTGEAYLRKWLGPRDALAAVSPVNLADKVKVPVFLAAGGKDERAPIQHTRRMEAALKRAGVPVETLYYPTEGHGFYTEPHRREFYVRLLAFLQRNLGSSGGAAVP